MAIAAPSIPVRLPRLREDLALRRGAPSVDGSETWLIHDTLQHRFIQIDSATVTLLSLWRQCATPAELASRAEAALGVPLQPAEIDKFAMFLEHHGLFDDGAKKGWRDLAAAAERLSKWKPESLAHNYLFFKIPLFKPEPFLRWTMPLVDALFTRFAAFFIGAMGIVGLYLVSRQWEAFVHAAWSMATPEGAAAVAATLFVVKAAHELGHAYTAIRMGCHVPSLGIAIVMMAPMPYTDVTDSWRLRDRRERMAIDAAGMAVELGLACIATFLWAFLPDGMPRTVAFLVATTSWTMSLAINLNPFMRFDGYYIMSDLTRVENLQGRSFALGVWRLREILFALRAPCPEPLPQPTVNWLVLYAWTTWAVRLVTFTGIALAVYTYFFKILGIVLFLFEIVYFIARPFFSEITEWWKMRKEITKRTRFLWALSWAAVVLGVIGLPWSATVYVPAVIEGKDIARVYTQRPSRVVSVDVAPGQFVAAGTVLATFDVPEIDNEEQVIRARLAAIHLRLARRSADEKDLQDNLVIEQERAVLSSRLNSLAVQRRQLELRAPISGHVVEVMSDLHPDRWLASKQQIALIDGSNQAKLAGYIAADDLWRVRPGATGTFVPEDVQAPRVAVKLTSIGVSGAQEIDILDLASTNGGYVAAEADAQRRLVPTNAQYRVGLEALDDDAAPTRTLRGVVLLTGSAESLLSRAWRRVLTVLVRESGA